MRELVTELSMSHEESHDVFTAGLVASGYAPLLQDGIVSATIHKGPVVYVQITRKSKSVSGIFTGADDEGRTMRVEITDPKDFKIDDDDDVEIDEHLSA